MVRPSFQPRVSIVVLALFAFAAGCNRESVQRVAVSGKVTFDGKPIPNGQIRFIPANGPVWSAWIKNGRYTTEGTKGVPVGDLQVRVEAYRIPSWYNAASGLTEDDEAPREQYVPPKYNVQSELKMTLEPGSGAVEKNFELVSR